jgi:hypothetical protein
MTIGRVDSTPNTVSLLDLDAQLDLQLSGDPATGIAALLLLSARDARHQTKAAAQAEEQHLCQLEDEQVEHMYDQADATRAAGRARGAGLILGGGVNIAGASFGYGKDAGTRDPLAQGSSGAGKAIEGGLNLVGTEYDFEANVQAAQATASGNRAKQVERRLQDLSEQQSDAAQLARAAIQSASDLTQAQTATDQATIFLRG